jgi:hypothetical protein
VAVEKNDQLDAGDLVVYIDASQVCVICCVASHLVTSKVSCQVKLAMGRLDMRDPGLHMSLLCSFLCIPFAQAPTSINPLKTLDSDVSDDEEDDKAANGNGNGKSKEAQVVGAL